MAGNSLGKLFRITTFGESHGDGVGVIVDGCPPRIKLLPQDFERDMARRKPGAYHLATSRKEEDRVEILSGVFEGLTTGTPLTLFIRNLDVQSRPYEVLRNLFRPSHADYTYFKKYGHFDFRGGGRSSARETAAKQMEVALLKAKEDGDSLGGVIEVKIKGCPSGLGEPVFDKLDADLAKAVMSVGAVKGVEIGAGFEAARLKGSENNDPITPDGFAANRAGGILGGISNGDEVVIRAAVKPVPSIKREQDTVDRQGRPAKLRLGGRHDVSAVPRMVPVLEAMTRIVIADHYLRAKAIG